MQINVVHQKKNNNRANVFFSWEYFIKYYIQFSECYLTWGRLAEVVTISPPYPFAWEWELSQTFYCPHPQSASKNNKLSLKWKHSCLSCFFLLPFVLNLHFICIEFTLLGVSNFTRQIQGTGKAEHVLYHLHCMHFTCFYLTLHFDPE